MEDDRVALSTLEPDQVVLHRRPLGRRHVQRRTVFLLACLRFYVVAAVGVVVYAFWRALHS